jgi:hypothetical protein
MAPITGTFSAAEAGGVNGRDFLFNGDASYSIAMPLSPETRRLRGAFSVFSHSVARVEFPVLPSCVFPFRNGQTEDGKTGNSKRATGWVVATLFPSPHFPVIREDPEKEASGP